MKKYSNEELINTKDVDYREMMFLRNIRRSFYDSYGFSPNNDSISLLEAYVSADEIYVEFIVYSAFASYLYRLHNDNIERIQKL